MPGPPLPEGPHSHADMHSAEHDEGGGEVKWGSHKNIHRALSDFSHWLTKKTYVHEEGKEFEPVPIDTFFSQDACVTIKMDGSNLGIHVVETGAGWIVESILGRKKPIWSRESGGDKSKLHNMGHYGNAGSLQALPLFMERFAIHLAEALKVKELAVYGEAYRAPGAACASWHPFGYKLPSKDWKVHRMTKQVHEQLMEAARACATATDSTLCTRTEPEEEKSEGSSSFDFKTMRFLDAFLVERKNHVVFPPPVVFHGSVGSAITSLVDVMTIKATPNFEGCFIVLESSRHGFKWKTGTHDEQPSIPKLDAFRFAKTERASIYKILLQVYAHKLEKPGVKRKAKVKDSQKLKEPSQMKTDVETAFARELSKRVLFADVPKKDRLPIAQEMVEGVVQEVLSRYSDATVACPYSERWLKAKASGMVKSLVMQV